MGDPSRADIDLEIGGRYEWLFDGRVGSNGCQVLSYIPDRMISFSWNAPPGQATRERRAWVVVETEALGPGHTRLRLTHLGFGQGPDWDETYAYFDAAWDRVLARMRRGSRRSDRAVIPAKTKERPPAPRKPAAASYPAEAVYFNIVIFFVSEKPGPSSR